MKKGKALIQKYNLVDEKENSLLKEDKAYVENKKKKDFKKKLERHFGDSN